MGDPEGATAPISQSGGKNQRHLRNYLLNLRYQLRYTLTIVAVAGLLTTILGYWIINQARETSRLIEVRSADPDDLLAKQLLEQMQHHDFVVMVMLGAFGLVLCIVIAIYGILLTHKVAGPLYKITLYLDRMRDGRLGTVYNLRKGDQLVEFFEHFKGAHDALRARTVEDIQLLDRAIAAVGANPVAEELRAARARKETSLK